MDLEISDFSKTDNFEKYDHERVRLSNSNQECAGSCIFFKLHSPTSKIMFFL